MKKTLSLMALIATSFISMAQGSLDIRNLTPCTLYATLDAMATSTGDLACSIQTNQIILPPWTTVNYPDATQLEIAIGWATPGSTAPYATNGIPGDFIYTDIVFNQVCACGNWINGYMGDGAANCFGSPTYTTFVGKTPPSCIVYGLWTVNGQNTLINFY